MKVLKKIEVIDSDIDRLGHVNYIQYISYLDGAREEWFEEAGITFLEIREKKMSTIVVNLDIQYMKEALLGDVLHVVTVPARLGNKSFVINQIIYNSNDEKIVEADITLVMFDLSKRKGMKVLDEIASKFQND